MQAATTRTLALALSISVLTAMFGCEDRLAGWQQIPPSPVGMYIVVDAGTLSSEERSRILADFDAGSDQLPDGYRWVVVHKFEYFIDDARVRARGGEADHLTVDTAPTYFEETMSLVLRSHEDRYYLLVHSRPPNTPELDPGKGLVVADARLDQDAFGRLAVLITVDGPSSRTLSDFSRAHFGRHVVLVVNDEVYDVVRIAGAVESQFLVGAILPRDKVFPFRHRIMGVVSPADQEAAAESAESEE